MKCTVSVVWVARGSGDGGVGRVGGVAGAVWLGGGGGDSGGGVGVAGGDEVALGAAEEVADFEFAFVAGEGYDGGEAGGAVVGDGGGDGGKDGVGFHGGGGEAVVGDDGGEDGALEVGDEVAFADGVSEGAADGGEETGLGVGEGFEADEVGEDEGEAAAAADGAHHLAAEFEDEVAAVGEVGDLVFVDAAAEAVEGAVEAAPLFGFFVPELEVDGGEEDGGEGEDEPVGSAAAGDDGLGLDAEDEEPDGEGGRAQKANGEGCFDRPELGGLLGGQEEGVEDGRFVHGEPRAMSLMKIERGRGFAQGGYVNGV